jgi:hypothetical protein
VPEVTGRPAYHPATLLKIYLYGYLNRIQSSRRLERETQRNIELMWLTGRLMPDFKTIADFRRDSGPAIRAACGQFVVLCRQFNLFTRSIVAIDGSNLQGVGRRRAIRGIGAAVRRNVVAEALDQTRLGVASARPQRGHSVRTGPVASPEAIPAPAIAPPMALDRFGRIIHSTLSRS